MDKPQYPSQFSQPSGPAPGQAPPQVPNPYGHSPVGGYPPPGNPGGDNPLGLIAMICGLLSLVMGCPLSIAAIILGYIGMKKEPKGMATAGLILGIVTVTLQLVVGCFVLAIYGLAFSVMAAGVAGVAVLAPYGATESAFQQAASNIESHQATAGAYPSDAEGNSLVQGTLDGWQNQIVYRQDGEEYILVSPGPDGIIDNEDDEEFYAYEYVAPFDLNYTPTQRALTDAAEAIEENSYQSDSDLYPADGEGQSLVAGNQDEWGRPVIYRQVDGGDEYVVMSPGADGMLDTPDDITYDGYEWTGDTTASPSIPEPSITDPEMSDPTATDPDAPASPASTKDAMNEAIGVIEGSNLDGYPADEAGTAMIAYLKDEWGNSLVYRKKDELYLIISPGPDGMLDTADDVNDETIEQSLAP